MPPSQPDLDVGTDNLDPRDRREAEQRSAPHVAVVHETIRLEGEEELERSPQALA